MYRNTGIIRRVDDLGRVAIPKEVRRQMKLTAGDPLEIYFNGSDEVTFKKYESTNLNEVIKNVENTLAEMSLSYTIFNAEGDWVSGQKINCDLGRYPIGIDCMGGEGMYRIESEQTSAYFFLRINESHSDEVLYPLVKMASLMLV